MHKYGWIPDLPDHRDFRYSGLVGPLPDHVDRIGVDNPIEDQENLGSCSGVSATSALEIVLKFSPLSKLMAYYEGRVLDGTAEFDFGASIRSVIKGLAKTGVCEEELWPYDVQKFATRPSQEAYDDAKKIIPLVSRYERITSIYEMKSALATGLPVVFGFVLPDYMESDEVAKTGWVRRLTADDSTLGGHAVVAVGYDSRIDNQYGRPPFIWARNSWGLGWGFEGSGYFMMDEAWFLDTRRLVDDMWVIHPKGLQ